MEICVSVIIPVYNAEKYLRYCLDSLCRQSFDSWEAICIDDGSSDNSLKILQEYAEKDRRFIVCTQKNSGVSAARNRGVDLAKGQYIMFMDCDDVLHSQCLAMAYAGAKESKADLVQYGYKTAEGWDKISEIPYSTAKIIKIYKNSLLSFFDNHDIKSVLVWDKIYKPELAKKITFMPVYPGEDDIYSFAAIAYASTYAKLANQLYFYVRHSGSIMRRTTKKQYRENRFRI